jgi:hypothetical protein
MCNRVRLAAQLTDSVREEDDLYVPVVGELQVWVVTSLFGHCATHPPIRHRPV